MRCGAISLVGGSDAAYGDQLPEGIVVGWIPWEPLATPRLRTDIQVHKKIGQ